MDGRRGSLSGQLRNRAGCAQIAAGFSLPSVCFLRGLAFRIRLRACPSLDEQGNRRKRSAYQGERSCLNIDRDPALEHRFLASTLRQFKKTKHPAFYTWILRAVKSLEDDLTNALIDEATAAPTDHLVMLEAVSSAPWVSELTADDPLVAAKLRGLNLRSCTRSCGLTVRVQTSGHRDSGCRSDCSCQTVC